MMTPKLWQAGTGAVRDVVVVLYCGDFSQRAVCAAAPDACIVNLTITPTALYTRTGAGGIPTLRDLVAAAQRLAGGDWSPGRVLVAAFSAGGQGATAMLDDGAEPDGLALADAWHCRIGAAPSDPALASRRRFVDAARAGARVLVASHTRIATESVRPTAEHPEWRPFTSTRGTLELLTGWALTGSGPLGAPVVHEDGGLRVESYDGTDGRAHELQAQRVLAVLVGEAMARLGGGAGLSPEEAGRLFALSHDVEAGRVELDDALARVDRDTDPSPAPPDPSEAPPDPPATTRGERLVAWMRAEAAAGVCEVPAGSNSGPRIRVYLAACTRNGKPLGLTAGAWCAASATFGAEAVRQDGEPEYPVRAAGVEVEQDAKAAGRWHSAADVLAGRYEVKVGDWVICTRGAPGGWERHVCVATAPRKGTKVRTIGGNENDRFGEAERSLSTGEVLGVAELV